MKSAETNFNAILIIYLFIPRYIDMAIMSVIIPIGYAMIRIPLRGYLND